MVTLARREFQCGRDILGFEQRVVAEAFLASGTRGEQDNEAPYLTRIRRPRSYGLPPHWSGDQ